MAAVISVRLAMVPEEHRGTSLSGGGKHESDFLLLLFHKTAKLFVDMKYCLRKILMAQIKYSCSTAPPCCWMCRGGGRRWRGQVEGERGGTRWRGEVEGEVEGQGGGTRWRDKMEGQGGGRRCRGEVRGGGAGASRRGEGESGGGRGRCRGKVQGEGWRWRWKIVISVIIK